MPAEEAESNERADVVSQAKELEAIFNTITDGLLVYNQHGRLTRTNSAARSMLGIENKPAHFYTQSIEERSHSYHLLDAQGQPLPPEQFPAYRILSGETLGGNQAVDFRIQMPEGHSSWLSLTGAPMYDQYGQISGVACILRDITERKRMQGHLDIFQILIQVIEIITTQSLHQNTSLFTGNAPSPLGQTILALTQRLLLCPFAILLGVEQPTQTLTPLMFMNYPDEQERRKCLSEMSLPALLHHKQRDLLQQPQAVIHLEDTDTPAFSLLFPASTSTGFLLPILRDQQICGMLGFAFVEKAHFLSNEERALLQDVSKLCSLILHYERYCLDRENVLKNQQELNRQLQESNQMQNTFISVISHEFRTALTSITGFSDVLRSQEYSQEETKDFANDIYGESARLQRMITEILDLEKMKQGQTHLQQESLDINTLLITMSKRVKVSVQHAIQLQLDQHAPQIQGDQDKLVQVFSNLLSNAIKYSPGGGDILLKTGIEGELVHIYIQDQGIGIPPDMLKTIFLPYKRVETSATRYIHGTGLGLSICKHIVEMHQGRIWIESQIGQGSTVHITLPRRA